MSTYLDMWTKIKELTESETDAWIRAVQPAQGQSIDFRGVKVIDVDVLEALLYHKEVFNGYMTKLRRRRAEKIRMAHQLKDHGYSTAETAGAMGLPESTIHSYLKETQ